MQNKHQRRATCINMHVYNISKDRLYTFVLLKQISVTKHSIQFISV